MTSSNSVAAPILAAAQSENPIDDTGAGEKQIHETTTIAQAAEVHRRAVLIDMHADTAQRLVDEKIDLHSRLSDGHLDAVRLRAGNVAAQFFAVWVDPHYYGTGGAAAIKRAKLQIDSIKSLSESHPDVWQMATSVSELEAAKRHGRIATLIGLEGGYALDDKTENLAWIYDAGVRYISPTWNYSVSWAGSSADEAGSARGLNDLGREMISGMNSFGIIVDVSHVSDKTFWDIAACASKPFIASHSNARAIAAHARNLNDDMIRAIASGGGCVCVVFYPAFIDNDWNESKNALQAQMKAEIEKTKREVWSREGASMARERLALERLHEKFYRLLLPPVSIARLVDHIDHIANLVGTNHIGVGSDFDGIQATPCDLTSAADYPNLTAELLRRGYTQSDVLKILGENMMRVMRDNQQSKL